MSRKRYNLTPAIQQSIVAFIRAGGYAHIAAEAAGIPIEVFESWVAKGEEPRSAEKYREFADAVRQAIAHARLGAEIDARAGKPLDWLRNGPGRQTQENVGWTGPPRGPEASPNAAFQMTPELQEFITALLDALTPHPEIREKVSLAVSKLFSSSAPKRTHRRSSQP